MKKSIAIVTGASSGLGREFVKELSFQENIDEIWVIARRRKNLEDLAPRMPKAVRILSGDLLEDDTFRKLDCLLHQEEPEIAFLVNNAGRGRNVSFEGESEKDVIDMMRLDMEVPVKMVSHCLPFMGGGSHILNVSSAAAFVPLPGLSIYSASKSFLLSFSRSLGKELTERHITVTALCPYWIGDTEFMEKAGVEDHPAGLLTAAGTAKAALRDCCRGRSLSIPGVMGKLTFLGGRFLPLSFLLFMKKIFHA